MYIYYNFIPTILTLKINFFLRLLNYPTVMCHTFVHPLFYTLQSQTFQKKFLIVTYKTKNIICQNFKFVAPVAQGLPCGQSGQLILYVQMSNLHNQLCKYYVGLIQSLHNQYGYMLMSSRCISIIKVGCLRYVARLRRRRPCHLLTAPLRHSGH